MEDDPSFLHGILGDGYQAIGASFHRWVSAKSTLTDVHGQVPAESLGKCLWASKLVAPSKELKVVSHIQMLSFYNLLPSFCETSVVPVRANLWVLWQSAPQQRCRQSQHKQIIQTCCQPITRLQAIIWQSASPSGSGIWPFNHCVR